MSDFKEGGGPGGIKEVGREHGGWRTSCCSRADEMIMAHVTGCEDQSGQRQLIDQEKC